MNRWEFNPVTNEYFLRKLVIDTYENYYKVIAVFKPKQIELNAEQALNWYITVTSLDNLDYGESIN